MSWVHAFGVDGRGRPSLHWLYKSKASRLGEAFRNGLWMRISLLGRFGFGGIAFRVLAAEPFYAAGGVHELLLAGEEGMAGGADFNADVAFVRRARNKCVPAGAMHPDLAVVRMDSCFHVNSTSIQTFDSIGGVKDSARPESSQLSAVSSQ